MANLRTGKYGGQYYGSYFSESEPLTSEEMHVNAVYIYQVLKYIYKWSDNAIAGILGNMQSESSLNAGRWQSDNVGNTSSGYGLVQWTPATKYLNWCESENRYDASDIDNNIERIIYELEHKIEYYPKEGYPLTFEEFTQSNETPYYLACAFAWNYERSAVVLWGTEEEQEALRQQRGGQANYWYEYLTNEQPTEPDIPTPFKKKKNMPVWMMCRYY